MSVRKDLLEKHLAWLRGADLRGANPEEARDMGGGDYVRRDADSFWRFAQQMSQEVRAWPSWKLRAAAGAFCSPQEEQVCRAGESDGDGGAAMGRTFDLVQEVRDATIRALGLLEIASNAARALESAAEALELLDDRVCVLEAKAGSAPPAEAKR